MKIYSLKKTSLWLLATTFLMCLILPVTVRSQNKIVIYPSAGAEFLSNDYHVWVNKKTTPVYLAKVGAGDDTRRFKAIDDLLHSDSYFDKAAFTYFDLEGSAEVSVSAGQIIRSVKILPSSPAIKYTIQKGVLNFTVKSPQNLTVEINGEQIKSLHIFINPIENNPPKATDPNVIYFGPGVHDVTSMIIGDNKTVYVAGGAIIRAVIGKDEKFDTEHSGLHNYLPTFILAGNHIRFKGRGIIDASACTTHARNMIYMKGSDIQVEGIILNNPTVWTVHLRQAQNVVIDNIKILGYRANSDGIDACNSSYVTIKKCFVRTNDDLIVIKTEPHEGPANHIIVKDCVLWNQLAHALSLGAELNANISDVLFSNCDIIHDKSREWSFRIFPGDSSAITNIRLDNIRIEEAHKFILLQTGGNAASPGFIQDVSFKNITVKGNPLKIEIAGGGSNKQISNVTFTNILLNGKPLAPNFINTNQFVKNVQIQP